VYMCWTWHIEPVITVTKSRSIKCISMVRPLTLQTVDVSVIAPLCSTACSNGHWHPAFRSAHNPNYLLQGREVCSSGTQYERINRDSHICSDHIFYNGKLVAGKIYCLGVERSMTQTFCACDVHHIRPHCTEAAKGAAMG
jgi:hypothetical protein